MYHDSTNEKNAADRLVLEFPDNKPLRGFLQLPGSSINSLITFQAKTLLMTILDGDYRAL